MRLCACSCGVRVWPTYSPPWLPPERTRRTAPWQSLKPRVFLWLNAPAHLKEKMHDKAQLLSSDSQTQGPIQALPLVKASVLTIIPCLDAGTPAVCCAARDYRSAMKSMNSEYFLVFSGGRTTWARAICGSNRDFPGPS